MDKMVDYKFKNFFKGKNILITGHTGFKGSWLSLILHNFGANVYGYSLPMENKKNHFELLNLKKLINHNGGDVRDYSSLKNVFEKCKPDLIFHLAAQALVKKSYLNPSDTFSTNFLGSLNILELSRTSKNLKSLIYVTSDKCYENKEWIWGYRENDQLGGHDPYSASKSCAEIMFSSYMKSFFNIKGKTGVASVRAGNVIGGGDWSEDRIVPDCINSIIENKTIILRNPNAVRPWQHVLEPLNGYMILSYHLYKTPSKFSGNWNFGPKESETLSVLDLSKFFISYFKSGKIKVEKSSLNAYETQLLKLNCDKANLLLSWRPKWDIPKTLEMTAEWYKRILEGENAKLVTIEQVEKFFNLKFDA